MRCPQLGSVDTIQGGARGIQNHGDLTLDDVIVRGNSAAVGAGVYNAAASTLTLHGGSSIRDNTATALGGGVINAGRLVMNGASSIIGPIGADGRSSP